jgi:hypothetical protein
MANHDIATELLQSGHSLWSSVECDVKRDYLVVYARLRADPPLGIEGALVESERLLKSVLEPRVGDDPWLAAVQWGERLCRTFTRR